MSAVLSRGAVWRPLLALVVALLVVSPSAWAEPVIDATSKDVPAEIDMSWIDPDVMAKVRDEDRADFEAHVRTAWRDCVAIIKDNRADGNIGFVDGACHEMDETGFSWNGDKSFLGHIAGNWAAAWLRMFGSDYITLKDLDLGALATRIAKDTPEVSMWRDIPVASAIDSSVYAMDQGSASAAAGGGGVAAQAAGAVAQAVGVPGTVVEAVANPTGAADRMLNQWKTDVSKGMSEALGWLSEGLSFDASLVSFRNAYAAAAGVGLVLLAGGSLAALASWRRSELPASEVVSRWGAAVLGGVLGLAFTPAMLYVVSEASDVLAQGVVSWMETDQQTITGSLLDPYIAMDTEHTLLGWLGVLLLILLMLIGAVMVIATFAIQWLVAYLGGVGLGLLWGLAPLKGGRRRLAQAGAMVVGAIVARPLMLFMLGVAMRITNQWAPSADGWSTDPSGTFFGLLLSVGALMMACLAPAALVRHVPAMGTGHLGAGFAGGLTGGLAGAGMGSSMLAGRMMALAPRRAPRVAAGGAGGGRSGGVVRAQAPRSSGGGSGAGSSGGAPRKGGPTGSPSGPGTGGQGRHVAGAEGGVKAPSTQGARESAVQRAGAEGAPSPAGVQGAFSDVSTNRSERSVDATRPAAQVPAGGSSGPGRVLTGADLSAQTGSVQAAGGDAPRVGGERLVGGARRVAGGAGRAASSGARVVAGAAGPAAGAAVAAGTRVTAGGVRAGGAALAAGARTVQSARVEDVD